MTPTQEELVAAITECQESLSGILAQGPTLKQKGHAPGCCHGMYLSGNGGPDPCSERCQQAKDAEAKARDIVERTTVAQLNLI